MLITYVQGGVLVWELESSHLAQRTLRLPAALLEAPLSALAVHKDGSLFLGDEQGGVWRLQVKIVIIHISGIPANCWPGTMYVGPYAHTCMQGCRACHLFHFHLGVPPHEYVLTRHLAKR